MRFPDLLTWECSIEHGLEEIKIFKIYLCSRWRRIVFIMAFVTRESAVT